LGVIKNGIGGKNVQNKNTIHLINNDKDEEEPQ
jgi:hypothetical protein